VGSPTTGEYSVARGRARRYAHGRIFSVSGAGTHEIYGPVLRPYVRRGAATSRLGFPTTRPVKVSRGSYARFQHGTLFVFSSGRVKVTYS
jgi:uncharacterized protein with LGFP repeats